MWILEGENGLTVPMFHIGCDINSYDKKTTHIFGNKAALEFKKM